MIESSTKSIHILANRQNRKTSNVSTITPETVAKADNAVALIIKHGFTNVFAICAMGLLFLMTYQSQSGNKENQKLMIEVVQSNTQAMIRLEESSESNVEAIKELKAEFQLMRGAVKFGLGD